MKDTFEWRRYADIRIREALKNEDHETANKWRALWNDLGMVER